MLPFSHDEVVHGKRSLLGKHPGDDWQRFAGYRAMLGYQWMLPGKKLIFMGSELAAPFEWNHEAELPFYLLEYPLHSGAMQWVADLNRAYREIPALHLLDHSEAGFQWIEANDVSRSTLAFLRSADGHPPALVVANFTPEVWNGYRVGVPAAGEWRVVLCSDAAEYGGSGAVPGPPTSEDVGMQGMAQSIVFDVPPMSVTVFAPS